LFGVILIVEVLSWVAFYSSPIPDHTAATIPKVAPSALGLNRPSLGSLTWFRRVSVEAPTHVNRVAHLTRRSRQPLVLACKIAIIHTLYTLAYEASTRRLSERTNYHSRPFPHMDMIVTKCMHAT
jgi:hypothetical protein